MAPGRTLAVVGGTAFAALALVAWYEDAIFLGDAPNLAPRGQLPDFPTGPKIRWPSQHFQPRISAPAFLDYYKQYAKTAPHKYLALPASFETAEIDFFPMDAAQILDTLQEAHVEMDYKAVDIGAGWSYDPSSGVQSDHFMAKLHAPDSKYRLTMLDGRPNARPDMRPGDAYFQTLMTPINVMGYIKGSGIAAGFDFLKVDIDGMDCSMAHTIVSALRPKVFVTEVTNNFPPPIEWYVGYEGWRDILEQPKEPMWGCSLSYAANHVARPLGYSLLQYAMEDAFFVRNEYLHLFGIVYRSPCRAYRMGNPWLMTQGAFPQEHGIDYFKEWVEWIQPGKEDDRTELFGRVARNATGIMSSVDSSRRFNGILVSEQQLSPYYLSVDRYDTCDF